MRKKSSPGAGGAARGKGNVAPAARGAGDESPTERSKQVPVLAIVLAKSAASGRLMWQTTFAGDVTVVVSTTILVKYLSFLQETGSALGHDLPPKWIDLVNIAREDCP